jgi:hypothetical protein
MEFHNTYPSDCARGAYEATVRYHDPSNASSLSYLWFFPRPSDSYAADGPAHEDAPLGHIDAITDDITAQAAKDPLAPFFNGQKAFLGKSVQDIVGLIYEREGLKCDNIRRIDYDAGQLKSKLFEIDSWRTGANPQIDKTRAQLDRDLLACEREKRFEEVACWRDTTRLKSELRETLGEFQREKRKESLLSGYEV